MLKDKTIILGVTGGIAAYKACEVVSRLKNLEADVWVVMTGEAIKLVAPLTFRTLSGNPVITDLFSDELSTLPVPHIALANKASLVVIAPATANIIGKLAHGIADDALTTICMASAAKKLVAPAMNCEMWRNPIAAKNVEALKNLDFNLIGPEEGKLACGEEDIGRMSEPEEIVEKIIELLSPGSDFKGKHILVTAGGTREAIDPVRYISNRSSGKMGYAIARAARERGAAVTLVSANVDLPSPLDIKPVKVESAAEMLSAVMEHYQLVDAVIMAAAVADFRPAKKSSRKIKKVEHRTLNVKRGIELEETEDILATIAKRQDRNGKVLVGFALETENLIQNAKKKLKEKNLDLIIANDDSTFDGNNIEFCIIDRSGKTEKISLQPKIGAANIILSKIMPLL